MELLRLGLTHRSWAYAIDEYPSSNERLEFLGDSVLGLVIAEQLYADFPDLREGELTKRKALLVSEATLAEIGISTGLNRYLLLAPEEEKSGGRERSSIVSDGVESVIGAVFLDGGFEAARDVVIRLIYTRESEIASDATRQNFKGELLEFVQGRGEAMPQYDVVSEEGPDHDKVFNVEVTLNGEKIGSGSGHSKKEAEQRAASAALEHVRRIWS
jgi:ribonuclease-3